MEDATARGAPPPTAEGDPYAFTLLSDPKWLSSDEARRLAGAFAALSWRATGGADWHTYEAGRVG